jgi:hypothetical protein
MYNTTRFIKQGLIQDNLLLSLTAQPFTDNPQTQGISVPIFRASYGKPLP